MWVQPSSILLGLAFVDSPPWLLTVDLDSSQLPLWSKETKTTEEGEQASHSSSTCYLGPLCPHPWVGLPLWRSSWGSVSASARSAPGGRGWRRSWVHRACRGTRTRSGLRTQSVSWFGCRSKPQRKGPGGLSLALAHPLPPHSLEVSPFQSAEWEWPHDKDEQCKQRPPWHEELTVTVWLWCRQEEGKTTHDQGKQEVYSQRATPRATVCLKRARAC